MGLSLVTAPVAEPVSLVEMREYLRITHTDDDDILSSLMKGARRVIENQTASSFMTTTWDMDSVAVHDFALDPLGIQPTRIYPPRQPVQSITHIKDMRTTQLDTTIDPATYALQFEASEDIAHIRPVNTGWPTNVSSEPNSCRIRFVAGYTSASLVPETVKLSIKMVTAHWYENRFECVSLLRQGKEYKRFPLGAQQLIMSIRPQIRHDQILPDEPPIT